MNTILLIEDEHDVRQGIVKALTYEDYRVLEAENGQQGIETARAQRPDLIICDIMMPERSGYSVLVELRKDPQTAMIPFIFLTALSGRADFYDGIQLGADAYITKPFAIESLLATVKAQLAQRDSSVSRHLDRIRVGLAKSIPPTIQSSLTGILGFSGLLAKLGKDVPPQPDDFQDIQIAIYDHARRLQRVLNNYVLYCELRVLQYDTEMREQWLAEEVPVTSSQAILEIATAKAREFQRLEDLRTNLSDDDVSLSPGLLHTVIEELLDNAFQFSQPGMPVQLEIQQTPEEIGIYVHDRGCGMTGEQLAAPERTYGLGLLVCRLLTELFAGTLAVHSEPGQGTTVAVIF
jgi:DNA-binding response OmpR family regulator